ncbi:helix-turn-helix domain-containing protein [Corynebacterium durum]|uniref:helix-turn-helix domain-containing protein n=1 Tax=Corynebacterium durum TaxID=61592 RepID=UPI00288BE101|nr:helix-turn-helix domain-containing protein [Corynebacterium durum]
MLHAISEGQTISISTVPTEVTTTTAASILDVSRPTVMKYIRNGRLSARRVGTHHRLNSQEVLELLEELKQEQRNAIFELIGREENLS